MKNLSILLFTIIFLIPSTSHAEKKEKEYINAVLVEMQSQNESLGEQTYFYKGYGNAVNSYTIDPKILKYSFFIGIDDLLYQTTYKAKWRWSHLPQWVVGDPIKVRIDKDKMYLLREDGKELKSYIVKKVRVEKENTEQEGQEIPKTQTLKQK